MHHILAYVLSNYEPPAENVNFQNLYMYYKCTQGPARRDYRLHFYVYLYVYDVVNPYLMFAQSYFIQILRIPSQCWALRAYLRIFVGHICGIPTQRVGAIYLCM